MPLVDGGNGGSGGGSLNMLEEEGQNDSELDLIHLSKVRRVNADSACVERVNVHTTCMYICSIYMCSTCHSIWRGFIIFLACLKCTSMLCFRSKYGEP